MFGPHAATSRPGYSPVLIIHNRPAAVPVAKRKNSESHYTSTFVRLNAAKRLLQTPDGERKLKKKVPCHISTEPGYSLDFSCIGQVQDQNKEVFPRTDIVLETGIF